MIYVANVIQLDGDQRRCQLVEAKFCERREDFLASYDDPLGIICQQCELAIICEKKDYRHTIFIWSGKICHARLCGGEDNPDGTMIEFGEEADGCAQYMCWDEAMLPRFTETSCLVQRQH